MKQISERSGNCEQQWDTLMHQWCTHACTRACEHTRPRAHTQPDGYCPCELQLWSGVFQMDDVIEVESSTRGAEGEVIWHIA